MKRSWTIRRQPKVAPDAQHRWDRAFQTLLRCTSPDPPPTRAAPAASHKEEVEHESRTICTCLDQPSGALTND